VWGSITPTARVNQVAATSSEMLNIHDLKVAYEQAIVHPSSNSTSWLVYFGR
jgi:hypothetical protein